MYGSSSSKMLTIITTKGQEIADCIAREADRGSTMLRALGDVCYKYAYEKGIIIADTKFEFGLDKENNLVLADEVFTPDSSRFWSIADYQVGVSPKSYDKQFIRDWLLSNKIGGEIQYDNVPDTIIDRTADIYQECLKKITAILCGYAFLYLWLYL